MDAKFWAIRNSLLPATPDMERAADFLAEAADMILLDRDNEAVALIHQADITALFDVREQLIPSARMTDPSSHSGAWYCAPEWWAAVRQTKTYTERRC